MPAKQYNKQERTRGVRSRALRVRWCQPTLKQGHAGSIIDPFLSGSFRLGARLSQATVPSNKCLAQTYVSGPISENQIQKPGRKVVSEKETYFLWRRQHTDYIDPRTPTYFTWYRGHIDKPKSTLSSCCVQILRTFRIFTSSLIVADRGVFVEIDLTFFRLSHFFQKIRRRERRLGAAEWISFEPIPLCLD